MKRIITALTLLSLVQGFLSPAQINMSVYAEASILTVGPGDQLNDAFGHSGIRIKDPMIQLDVVFDYGRYDFSAEGFYVNFAKGKLDYQVGWVNFDRFLSYYTAQQRRVESQILNLNPTEIQRLFQRLQVSILPQNKTYAYDFFYNNCATKIKDDLVEISENAIQFLPPKEFEPLTFRELIRTQVPLNSWGGFGIDLALGSVIDQKANLEEHLFLPSYLRDVLETSKFTNTAKNAVKKTEVLNQTQKPYPNSFWSSPLLVFGILSILSLYITLRNYNSGVRSRSLDVILFSTTGLIGVVLVWLWFATDHTATAYNYNLLWAFVFNLLLVPTVVKHKVNLRVVAYLKFLILLLFLMLLHWFTGVQSFNIAVLPIWLAMMFRYLYLIHWCNNNLNSADQ